MIAQKLVREHHCNPNNESQIQHYRNIIADLSSVLHKEVAAVIVLDNQIKQQQQRTMAPPSPMTTM